MATAGRTVACSAATVSAALVTLTLFPQDFLKSMGIAGATVAAVAAASGLVISPVLFALWGAKLARRRDARDGDGWHRLAHWVMRRARLVAPLTAIGMVALALPARHRYRRGRGVRDVPVRTARPTVGSLVGGVNAPPRRGTGPQTSDGRSPVALGLGGTVRL